MKELQNQQILFSIEFPLNSSYKVNKKAGIIWEKLYCPLKIEAL